MYALIAFREGYQNGNVWEIGTLEQVLGAALYDFTEYGLGPEMADRLVRGERVNLLPNPYEADYIQLFFQYNQN